jgi:uncharacterized protein YbjT (DUF2867 family)
MEQTTRNPVVAISGVTGNVGSCLVESFLSEDVCTQLSGLVLLSRRHTPRTKDWESKGAQVRVLDDADDIDQLVAALEGVDVLINA